MKNILGYRDFLASMKIRNVVKTSKNYSGENTDTAEMFFFFETSKQKTWIVATNKRIYIVLDDVRKETVKVNMSYKLNLDNPENRLTIKVETDYKSMYGRVYFKDFTKGWLYSKELFPIPLELENKINYTIEKVLK